MKHLENNPQKEYKKKQAEIAKLIKQIQAGLEEHNRKAERFGDRNWGYFGDLEDIAVTLTDIKDRLHGTGEYAEVGKTW
jgi:hypothetical protein